MSGDLNLYTPGSQVTVTLVADATGAYPERGDGVALTGDETSAHPEASVVSGSGEFVGTLVDLPPATEEDEIEADDVIGDATVLLRHYVDWLPSNDATLAPGDLVVYGADGVTGQDTEPATDVVGRVWKTGSNELGTDGKVAVVRTA